MQGQGRKGEKQWPVGKKGRWEGWKEGRLSEWDLYENSIAFLVQSVDHSLFTRLILSGHLIRLNGLCGFHGLKSVDGRDLEKISIAGLAIAGNCDWRDSDGIGARCTSHVFNEVSSISI